jgi:hypothetical protein
VPSGSIDGPIGPRWIDAARFAGGGRRPHGSRHFVWLGVAVVVATWALFVGAPVVGASGPNGADAAAAAPFLMASSGGSVPLVLLGLAIGALGLLILSPMPLRARRSDED